MKKRVILTIMCYLILIIAIAILINIFNTSDKQNTNKIKIIVTIYPEYDFVSKIGGENVEITRLIEPGIEAHTYEPSVRDMKNITDSDLFIYTNDSMEPWVKIIKDSMNSDTKILNCSKNIKMIETDEFMERHNILEEHEHSNETKHEYEFDGHVWLNPKNAIIMIDTICEELVEIDPKNKQYYEKNANDYKSKIEVLDKEIENEINENKVNTLVFGGEFSYTYFCDRYNLDIVTAYSACGDGAEPSVSKIKDIIEFINSNKINKVFYQELTEGTVANMIAEETDAKAVVFNTLHNISNEEINNGKDYVSVMEENLKIICK